MIRFASPWFFLLLLIPLLFLLRKKKPNGHVLFSDLSLIKKAGYKLSLDPRHLLKLMRIIALVLFICALGRPQMGKHMSEVNSEGVDIFLVLDTSGSMQAMDFEKNGERADRLSIVKDVVSDFVQKRAGDRIGLVVFGNEAYTQCPLTMDHEMVLSFLDHIKIGMAGEATALGSAIGVAANRMKDLKAKSKVMILLTDGSSNAGQIGPLDAAKMAAALGMKIYTIGIGSTGEAPMPVNTIFGRRLVNQPVEMDEDTLKQIASMTGASYFNATKTEELQDIYAKIDKLEKVKVKIKEYTEYNELFPYFLIPGLILLLLEVLLSQTLFRVIP